MNMQACELCAAENEDILFQTGKWRVILVDDKSYPGFCRVIWQEHAREMTDLSPADRAELMAAVWEVEAAIREVMQPDKVNLASLGNVVPHLHWHVIPRFERDAHFPAPIWAEAQRDTGPQDMFLQITMLPTLRLEISKRLADLDNG